MKTTLTDRVKTFSYPFLLPIVKILSRSKIHPNLISIIGATGFIIASLLVGMGKFLAAGITIAISGPLDAIDGALARYTGKVTRFGAFLDSTLDRYAEIFLFLGFTYYFLNIGENWGVILSFLAITGSLMVSYTRARAEGAGFECRIGLLTRFERLFLLTVSLFFNLYVYVIGILAILTHFTALQRIFYVYNQYTKKGE